MSLSTLLLSWMCSHYSALIFFHFNFRFEVNQTNLLFRFFSLRPLPVFGFLSKRKHTEVISLLFASFRFQLFVSFCSQLTNFLVYMQHGQAVTCCIDMQHWYAALTCSIDMQHWHAALICSIDMQHWYAALACSIDMQHWHAAWTCSIDMQHGHAALTCSMDMQQWHAALTCSMDKQHENAARTCSIAWKSSIDMHGHAAWIWIKMLYGHEAWILTMDI